MNDRSLARLEVLLRDYGEARDDERTFITMQGAMVALGVSAVGALFVFTENVLDRSSSPEVAQFPSAMIATAPFMPLVIVVFTIWVGSTAVVRSFYMRAVGREVRGILEGEGVSEELASYEGLRILSLEELTVEHDSLSRCRLSLANGVIYVVIISLLAVFGGITVVLALHVDLFWRWNMVALYVPVVCFLLWQFRALNREGRVQFETLVKSYHKRLGLGLNSAKPHDSSDGIGVGFFFCRVQMIWQRRCSRS